jgi:hypothetical protein
MNQLANAYQLGKFVPHNGELSVFWNGNRTDGPNAKAKVAGA